MKQCSMLFVPLLWALGMVSQAQGPLDPSSPPLASMKTLDQMEPRYPISDIPFVIEKPGSYYLTRSLSMVITNEPGITVAANDVVLDLNGFVLEGYSDGGPFYDSGSAIFQSNSLHNLTLMNGSIYNWNGQQHEGVGMIELQGANNRIKNITIRYCARGLRTGAGSLVEGCLAQDLDEGGIAENYGFWLGKGSVARDCVAENIHGDDAYGFTADINCVLERCVSRSNITFTGGAGGFELRPNSQAIGCSAYQNSYAGFVVSESARVSGCIAQSSRYGFILYESAVASDCVAADCSTAGVSVADAGVLVERCTVKHCGDGIVARDGGTVRDCVIERNLEHGIHVKRSGNAILRNTCYGNGMSGIFVFEDGNRIEENHLANNDYGLYFRYWGVDDLAERNIALRNTAFNNITAGFHEGVSNSVAPIETSTGAFSNSWANFQL